MQTESAPQEAGGSNQVYLTKGPSPPFIISKLPIEIQLLILSYCLIAPVPLLNFKLPATEWPVTVPGERRGQDDISPQILRTCKLFYHEGRKFLHDNKEFCYTTSNKCLTCRPSFCSCFKEAQIGAEAHIWVIEDCWLRSQSRQLARLPDLQLLILRPTTEPDWYSSRKSILDTASWIRQIPRLKFLRIDNVRSPNLDFLRFPCQIDFQIFKIRSLKARDYLHQREVKENWRTLHAGLDEIVLTGLTRDAIGLHMIERFSCLLHDDGQIGHSMGLGGARYVCL